jgi:hypothetical protein
LDIDCDSHATHLCEERMWGFMQLRGCEDSECAIGYGVACGGREPIAKRRGEARTAIVAG